MIVSISAGPAIAAVARTTAAATLASTLVESAQ